MSDCVSDADGAVSSLPSTSDSSNSTPVALSDVSPKDKPWDKHRSNADKVAALYASGSEEFQNYADRVTFCSELLGFGLTLGEADTLQFKLRSAHFCRVRHCPVCQWRRSLMWKARSYKVLPRIVEAYPTHRWLFLTLTQKNVPITELKRTLIAMNRAFQRLSQLKMFPAIGWLRSTEVTRGRNGTAHPHFHCLLMVPASYFGRNYIKQDKWVKMWRKSLRLDYNPVIDVQAVKQGSQPMELVPEILKYCIKESDLVADKEWFLELTRQMFRMKCVTTGGVLKEYLKELEEEPEDLIGESDVDNDTEDKTLVYFGWRKKDKKYRMLNLES